MLALLGLEYLSGVGYLLAVVASGVLLHLAMGGALPARWTPTDGPWCSWPPPICWWSP